MEKLIMKIGTVVADRIKHQSVSKKNSVETWRINAYSEHEKDSTGKTTSWKYSGSEFLDCFVEDDKGVEKARKAYNLAALKTENRQRKQDVRNNVASGKAGLSGIKQIKDKDPETFEDLMEFGRQIASVKAGTLDKVDPALISRLNAKPDRWK